MRENPNNIIEALAHIICADEHSEMLYRDVDRISRVDPMWFDGFDVLDMTSNEKIILRQRDFLDLPVWPLDVCFASPLSDGLGWESGAWQFARVSTLNQKRWRGKLRINLQKMVEVGVAVTEPSGFRRTSLIPLGLTKSGAIDCRPRVTKGLRINSWGDWRYALNPSAFNDSFAVRGAEKEMEFVQFASGFALRRRYNWSVLLSDGPGPRARFITDLTGVKDVFRLRDIPPGKARRAALRHWVSEHWRKRRQPSDADKIWVKAHLRGAEKFNWNGLRCEMVPPELLDVPAKYLAPETGLGRCA